MLLLRRPEVPGFWSLKGWVREICLTLTGLLLVIGRAHRGVGGTKLALACGPPGAG